MNTLLIDTTHPEETVSIVLDNDKKIKQVNYDINGIKKGNIYYAAISNIDHSLNAVFVNFGGIRPGFLPLDNIHESYFKNGEKNLKNLHKDQILIVQIEKEARGLKGAYLTTYICLLGRYCVLMIDSKMGTGGISKKIQDSKERDRLNEIREKLKLPEGISVILRTAVENATLKDIKQDSSALLKIWKKIVAKSNKVKKISPAYEEANGVIKALRDMSTKEITEIKVLDQQALDTADKFGKIFLPKHIQLSKMNAKDHKFFWNQDFQTKIDELAQNKIQLPSGGFLVITYTEALIAIDVNSGKAKTSSFEVNQEAAKACIEQIFLKNLHGIIVIDMIDMNKDEEYTQIEKIFKDGFELDKARVKVVKINSMGLLELSRQRIQPSIYDWLLEKCHHCNCLGASVSMNYIGRKMLRQIYHQTISNQGNVCRILASKNLCSWILNEKMQFIENLKQDFRINLKLTIVDHCQADFYRIEWN